MVKETRLYDLLGVSTEADDKQIRRAYKAQALKYHPDKQQFQSEEERRKITDTFSSITEAYEILSDSKKKYIYDKYGENSAKNPDAKTAVFSTDNYHYDHNRDGGAHFYGDSGHTFTQHMDFHKTINSHFAQTSHLFNQFFSDFGTSKMNNDFNVGFDPFGGHPTPSNKPRSRTRKGRDIEDNINCTLLDYYNGKKIKLSLSRRIICPTCKALGGLKVYTCNDCCGSGMIINEMRSGMLYQRTQSTCARCHGTGEFIPAKDICPECHGNKLVDTKVIFDFKSPRGVSDGYRVVIPNAADEGVDLIPGDVILTLRDDKASESKKFRRRRNDLLSTVSVPLATALLGGCVEFTHIDGSTIKIGLRRGELRSANDLKILKGYGMPIHRGDAHAEKSQKRRSKKGSIPDEGTAPDAETQEFGNLILNFRIELPDVRTFTEDQIDAMSGVLGAGVHKMPWGGAREEGAEGVSASGASTVHLEPLSGVARSSVSLADFPQVFIEEADGEGEDGGQGEDAKPTPGAGSDALLDSASPAAKTKRDAPDGACSMGGSHGVKRTKKMA